MKTLPKGWKKEKLSDYLEMVIDYRGKTPAKADKGILTLSAKSVKMGEIDYSQAYFISKETYKEFMVRGFPKVGDILMTTEAPLGCIAKLDRDDVSVAQRLLTLRGKEKQLDNDYLMYYLMSPIGQFELLSRASGSTVQGIKRSEFEKVDIVLPTSYNEQKEIANIISSFDKKIELLKEQNQTLETMAQTIFKEWFVDFNYPNATGEMIESEMGEIPKEWKIGRIGNEFDITIGRTPPRQESHWFSEIPQGMKWASIKDMGNAGVYIFNTSEYLVDEAIEKFNIPIIPENTAILSFKMTVGKVSITTEKMLSNEAIAHMKIKKDSFLTSEYIYLFLLNLNFNSLGSTSSIVMAINTAIIKQIKFFIPDEITMKDFNQLVAPIFKKIKNNSEQIQTLEETRDSLLPKLMSGQKRVFEYDN